MANTYTTKTAALKATKADINKLDAKKMLLNGKNILEYINEKTTVVLDERGTLANDELDIWNSYVTKDVFGNVIINRSAKPFEHNYAYLSSTGKISITRGSSCVHVINNEVLDANNEHVMYWQTDGLTSSQDNYVFSSNIKTFSSDLSSLTNGRYMFDGCTNLTSFNGDLSSLTNGYEMFRDCTKLNSFNYKNGLQKIENGYCMFYNTELSEFNAELPNLKNASWMFFSCPLTSFNSDLPSLTDGTHMFKCCGSLTSFKSDLSSLTNGYEMFYSCSQLNSFSADLPSLTYGVDMFNNCTNLTSFYSDLPSLTNGHGMFKYCENLNSFTSDLSSLTDGYWMFGDCSKLTSFNSSLSSLTDGYWMFGGCKLDAPSVANIIHFIPQRDAKPTSTGNGNIYIGIGITNTDAAKQAFAEECDCTDWAELNKEFDDKNWAVQWQFNGPVSYSLRDPRPSTLVYTKLVEVFMPTEEEIAAAKEKGEHIETPHYEYVSQDGDNYYNIHWYHDSNTNNEGYDCFESLEMATLSYGVLPKD